MITEPRENLLLKPDLNLFFKGIESIEEVPVKAWVQKGIHLDNSFLSSFLKLIESYNLIDLKLGLLLKLTQFNQLFESQYRKYSGSKKDLSFDNTFLMYKQKVLSLVKLQKVNYLNKESEVFIVARLV